MFSTASAGIIEGTADADNVLRRRVWLDAHPGGTIELVPGENGARDWWTAAFGGRPFPSPEDPVPPSRHLRELMDDLDRAERRGRCPVHGTPS